MRKFTTVLAPAFVLAASLAAYAQEKPITTTKGNSDTVRVNVRGKLVLDYVERSGEIAAIINAPGNGDPGASNTIEGYVAVGFDVELTDKVAVVVEIGTRRADNGAIFAFGESSVSGQDIGLREARIAINDFLAAGLRLEGGILNWGFDVDGKGGSLFNPRQSQSITRNMTGGSVGGISAPDVLDPVGALLVYERDAIRLDIALIPAVLEGGQTTNDEAIYAASFFYKFDDKGSRIGAMLAAISTANGAPVNAHGTLIDFGGGVTLNGLVQNLSLSAEIHVQFGEVVEDVDAAGIAFQLAGNYTFEGGFMVGLILTYLSGNDGTDATEETNYVSYEDIGDLAIIEDMYYGLDWDTNYMAIKIHGSLPLSVGGGKNNLVLSAILGIVTTNEDVGTEDGLGNELDIRARYEITKQVALHALLGFLFGSDILELTPGGNGEDSAILFALGFDLGF
jgi:hypothetical protein